MVTPVGRVGVGVAAAVAGLAGVAHLQWVAVVTVGTSANFGRVIKENETVFRLTSLPLAVRSSVAPGTGVAHVLVGGDGVLVELAIGERGVLNRGACRAEVVLECNSGSKSF